MADATIRVRDNAAAVEGMPSHRDDAVAQGGSVVEGLTVNAKLMIGSSSQASWHLTFFD